MLIGKMALWPSLEALASQPQQDIIEFLRDNQIIHSVFSCKNCSLDMSLVLNRTEVDGFIMRCARCQSQRSIRYGSILFRQGWKLSEFIKFLYYWSLKLSCEQMGTLLSKSRMTIIKWTGMLRMVCSWKLLSLDVRLGGQGMVVQIDESVVNKAKYHRGHTLYEPQKWIFGIYEVSTKRGLVFMVPNRKSETLLPLIQTHILPGTEIHSDCWPAYQKIGHIPVTPRYIHKTVNHKRFFKDPVTAVHTNNAEAYWSSVKRRFKVMNGATREMTPSYLHEHMYRQRFGKTVDEMFINIVQDIGSLYIFE
jgi:hypothetical protein